LINPDAETKPRKVPSLPLQPLPPYPYFSTIEMFWIHALVVYGQDGFPEPIREEIIIECVVRYY